MNPQEPSSSSWQASAAKIEEYWSWVAGALYLLLTVDLLTSLVALDLYGPAAEANPYMRWALTQDLLVVVGIHLAALALLVVLFQGIFLLLERSDGQQGWLLARSFECWVGLLLAAGLFVFANNLSVILLGGSLV